MREHTGWPSAAPTGSDGTARLAHLLAGRDRSLLLAGLPPGEREVVGPPLVIAPEHAGERLVTALAAEGWTRKGSRWALFAQGSAELVDVVAPATIGLPDAAFYRLTAQREELSLSEELWLRALAAPVHGPVVPARFRAACHRLLGRDPAAWLRAHGLAAQHGAQERVVALQNAYETGLPLGGPAGWSGRAGGASVVALSGLDGAGKSTQAHLLAAGLHSLCFDVAVEWARIGFNPGLGSLAAPVKAVAGAGAVTARRLKALVPNSQTVPADVDRSKARNPAARDPQAYGAGLGEAGARRVRPRHPILDGSWSVLVAGADVVDSRRRQSRHAAAGRVVVRDRYLLDSVVHLGDRYGGNRTTAAAREVLKRTMPPPLCMFLLEIPAVVAHRRKPAEWTVEDLQRHAAAYARAADQMGAYRIDADQEPFEVAAAIARTVWQHLP